MKTPVVLLAVALALGASAAAQPPTHQHTGQAATQGQSPGRAPEQAGEAAFAAIQETVSLLEAYPSTDWSKVDIEALRQHLIDMSNVTLRASVRTVEQGDAITFQVVGDGDVRGSVQRMIPAHASTMSGNAGWRFSAELTSAGANLTVTPAHAKDLEKVRALGFIGVVSLGAHHQHHHFMIASGTSPHH